jgi:antirestriction protein ArdC
MKPEQQKKILSQIIGLIETHGSNWIKPWEGGASFARPYNASSNRKYNGINVLILAAQGYADPRWDTYKGWQAQGLQVGKGVKSTTILAPQSFKKTDDNGDVEYIFGGFRPVSVFNAVQVGAEPLPVPEKVERDPAERIAEIEAFIAKTGADIRIGGDVAAYYPSGDYITLPALSAFHGSPTSPAAECYYSTALHELAHWTGSKTRLNRLTNAGFGTEGYAKEELVAELSACFLCLDLGISSQPRPDHAAYLGSWLGRLKGKDGWAFLTEAQRHANRAVDFLTALQSQEEAA